MLNNFIQKITTHILNKDTTKSKQKENAEYKQLSLSDISNIDLSEYKYKENKPVSAMSKKETTKDLRLKHHKQMEEKYSKETTNSYMNTTVYHYDHIFPVHHTKYENNIILEDIDSTSAILKYVSSDKKTAILNFANYYHPGGGYLAGAVAQEEMLCAESNLYNVINLFNDTFYNENNILYSNNGYGYNRALYSPDIIFIRGDKTVTADVITCAAVNLSNPSIDNIKNNRVMRDRIKFIISIAEEQGVDNLILGAFGCGCFGQEPMMIAQMFKEELSYYNCFEKIIFAIPKGRNNNYDYFHMILFPEKGLKLLLEKLDEAKALEDEDEIFDTVDNIMSFCLHTGYDEYPEEIMEFVDIYNDIEW